MIHPTAKLSEEGSSSKCYAMNTVVQLSTPYTNTGYHNVQRHRQMERQQYDENRQPYCVTA